MQGYYPTQPTTPGGHHAPPHGGLRHTLAMLAVLVLSALWLPACGTDPVTGDNTDPDAYNRDLDPGNLRFNLPVPANFPAPKLPEDNELTKNKILLGKQLFFDPILSSSNTKSCATCHKPEHGFSSPERFPIGDNGLPNERQAPSLTNAAYLKNILWEGGLESLELHAQGALLNPFELNATPSVLLEELRSHPTYPDRFYRAFGIQPEALNIIHVSQALAAYERVLLSGNSPYDQAVAGQQPLSEAALRGRELFFTEKAECWHCHSGFDFADDFFHNNGLLTEDPGRWRITQRETDRGRFKTPTLRNLSYTAPYMHDGRFATLEEVLDHYAAGGQGHPNQSAFIDRINLTEAEKSDLIAFLHSLSDPQFLADPDGPEIP